VKFSALNIDFSSPCPDLLDSRRPVPSDVKEGFPLKSGYFTAIVSSNMKRLQIGTDLLLIITSTSHELFGGVNINNPE